MASLCLLVVAYRTDAAPEMTLGWSAKDCLPGDVMKLQVRITSSDVTGFDLKLPQDEAIEWLSHERGPLRYQSGIYSQEDSVVAQATHPGTLILNGLHALIRDGETTSDRSLSAPPLLVGSFGELADDFKPEPLLTKSAKTEMKHVWWLWITAGFLVVGGAVSIFRRKSPEKMEEIAMSSVSAELAEWVDNTEMPVAKIERILAERSGELSVELREVLEAAVYGKMTDLKKICKLLEREVAR